MSLYRNIIWQILENYRIFIDHDAWHWKLSEFEDFYFKPNTLRSLVQGFIIQGNLTPVLLCYVLLVLYYQLGMNSSKFTDSELLPSSFKSTLVESKGSEEDEQK